MMKYFAVLKKLPKESMDRYIKSSLEIVNLEDKLKDKISTLSGGMIRRLGIAQAILGSPKIIIFDEPTAGLDPEERLRFKNLLRSEEHTSELQSRQYLVCRLLLE